MIIIVPHTQMKEVRKKHDEEPYNSSTILLFRPKLDHSDSQFSIVTAWRPFTTAPFKLDMILEIMEGKNNLTKAVE